MAKLSKRLPEDNEKLQPLVGEISWGKNLIFMVSGKDNLKREFYHVYRDLPKVQPLVAQIGWSHNLNIFQRCKDYLEREFYIRMIRKFGWTRNVLIHQIENQNYENNLLGQTNFNKALTPGQYAQAKLAVNDEYTFDFFEMGEYLNTVVATLTATIKNNFEEVGV